MKRVLMGKYLLGEKLGSGGCGQIYQATNLETKQEVAIKLESDLMKGSLLLYEAKIYEQLRGGVGIPICYDCGVEGDCRFLVVQLLGRTLESLFAECRRKFSLKTVLMIALQMLQRIEFMHSRKYIHRDIKPENILMGLEDADRVVYLSDFGLARRYIDRETGCHIPYIAQKKLTGTARYASLNTHLGIEQSRRDDLETLGYVLMYLLRGGLPWQQIPVTSKEEAYEKIKQLKLSTCYDKMCAGCPEEFATYLKYCTELRFDETPDYNYLKMLFKNLFGRSGYKQDWVYDWVILRHKSSVLLGSPGAQTESSPSKATESSKTPRAEDSKEASPSSFVNALAGIQRFPCRTESSPLPLPVPPALQG